jgi:hypothetical protein
VSETFLDRYVAAWLGHVDVRGPEGEAKLQALLALMADNVEYVDVPTDRVSHGHDGVRQMATNVSNRFDEIRLEATSAQMDGRRYAIEYTVTIRFDPAREIILPGVAVGETGTDGKVTLHRDYYDRSPFPVTSRENVVGRTARS